MHCKIKAEVHYIYIKQWLTFQKEMFHHKIFHQSLHIKPNCWACLDIWLCISICLWKFKLKIYTVHFSLLLLSQKIPVMASFSSWSSYFFDLSIIFMSFLLSEHMIPMVDLAKAMSRALVSRQPSPQSLPTPISSSPLLLIISPTLFYCSILLHDISPSSFWLPDWSLSEFSNIGRPLSIQGPQHPSQLYRRNVLLMVTPILDSDSLYISLYTLLAHLPPHLSLSIMHPNPICCKKGEILRYKVI